MYVSSDEQCSFQPSNPPISTTPTAIAAQQAANNALTQQIGTAASAWQGLLNRQWQSFADLGPNVAYQLRSGNPDTVPAAAITSAPAAVVAPSSPSAPVGVTVVPTSAGVANSPAAASTSSIPTTGNGPQILKYFNYQPMYKMSPSVGKPGTVRSLTMGGASQQLSSGGGVNLPPTPNPASGAYGGSCPQPTGVAMTPWGEPQYPQATSGGSASSGPSGIALALIALLGLGFAGYVMQEDENRRGRRAA